MAKVKSYAGEGGAGIAELETLLNEVVDDLTELRNRYIALLQKLDLDAGVSDVDYESTLTPAALKTVRSDA